MPRRNRNARLRTGQVKIEPKNENGRQTNRVSDVLSAIKKWQDGDRTPSGLIEIIEKTKKGIMPNAQLKEILESIGRFSSLWEIAATAAFQKAKSCSGEEAGRLRAQGRAIMYVLRKRHSSDKLVHSIVVGGFAVRSPGMVMDKNDLKGCIFGRLTPDEKKEGLKELAVGDFPSFLKLIWSFKGEFEEYI